MRLVLLVPLLALGCDPAPSTTPSRRPSTQSTSPAAVPTARPPASAASGATWRLGTALSAGEWDGGATSGLSGWKELRCGQRHGPDHLLSGIEAWREPDPRKKSYAPEEYATRLEVRCSRYESVGGIYRMTPSHHDAVLYEMPHRGMSRAVQVRDAVYANGVLLDLGADQKHIRQMTFTAVSAAPDGSLRSASAAFPWVPEVTRGKSQLGFGGLQCPEQNVITGIGVRHDTRSGKIRSLRIYCRSLRGK